jgi:uncharacterized membrane protein
LLQKDGGLALRLALGAILGTVLAARGRRRRSLTPSGALAAALVGAAHVAAGLLPFGTVLLVFFYGSSAATRAGSKRKAQLEEGFHTARGARQVFSNGLGGALAALVASAAGSGADVRALIPPLARRLQLVLGGGSASSSAAAALGWLARIVPPPARLAELARAAFVAHYACCMGDTLASEIGVLSASPPRLATRPGRRVPPGTNGGVTTLGLAAAAAGGLVVGLAFAFASTIAAELVAGGAAAAASGTSTSSGAASFARAAAALLVGDGAALAAAGFGATAATASALLGVGAGLAGAMLDSVLGATCQYSGVRLSTGRCVNKPGPGVRHTCGRDWLSNDAVNAVSALVAGVAAAAVTAAGF